MRNQPVRNSNNDDQSSLDDWTVPSTVETTTAGETESFVHIATKVLNLSVTPRNESIGIFSSPQNSKTTKVCVNIQACELTEEDEEKRPPVDIIVALDISVSMKGGKLKDCKRTLELVIRNLGSKDRLGLVTYGSHAKVEFAGRFMTPDSKELALSKVKDLHTTGSTNLSGGLSLAAQEMQLITTPNPVRSIFLLTDGFANIGITRTDGLVAMAESLNESNPAPPSEEVHQMNLGEEGDTESVDTKPKAIHITRITASPISLFSFGYGSNHNSNMLRAIANATPGGAYYFVDNDSDVSTAFGDAMGGLLSVVGQSATLTLSVPPALVEEGVKILDIYHDEKLARDNGTFTVNMGDFYAEESRDVLVELQLANNSSDTPVPHLTVMLSYMDTLHNKPAKEGPVQCLIARPSTVEVSPTNMHVEAQWLRVRTVQEMAAADNEARSNNLSAARARMETMNSLLTTSPAYAQETTIAMALVDDVQTVLRGFESSQAYRSSGAHTIQLKGMSHSRQRCMNSTFSACASKSGDAIYTNRKKMKMSVGFTSQLKEDPSKAFNAKTETKKTRDKKKEERNQNE